MTSASVQVPPHFERPSYTRHSGKLHPKTCPRERTRRFSPAQKRRQNRLYIIVKLAASAQIAPPFRGGVQKIARFRRPRRYIRRDAVGIGVVAGWGRQRLRLAKKRHKKPAGAKSAPEVVPPRYLRARRSGAILLVAIKGSRRIVGRLGRRVVRNLSIGRPREWRRSAGNA